MLSRGGRRACSLLTRGLTALEQTGSRELAALSRNNTSRNMATSSSASGSREKKYFTPGPMGISLATKQAMLRDIGSREHEMVQLIRDIRTDLVHLAGVSTEEYTCVLMQGSGTFTIEAVLNTTTSPKTSQVLILENGAYGRRQAKICEMLGIRYHLESFGEDGPVRVERVDEILRQDTGFTHVSLVHNETSIGVINPIEEVGKLVKERTPDAVYFVDAMSSFGAIPVNMAECRIDYLVSSSNKCIEGSPGFAFTLARKEHLMSCKGQARSLVLDLVDQLEGFEKNGQFRFTPPTHCLLAFRDALKQLEREGGVEARAKRYAENNRVMREGMAAMGFKETLRPEDTGYIIANFFYPKHKNFDFDTFYDALYAKDLVIYRGKLLTGGFFRLGNIGHLFARDMEHLLTCIREVLQDMDIPVPLQE